jgi:hypothetical protein
VHEGFGLAHSQVNGAGCRFPGIQIMIDCPSLKV